MSCLVALTFLVGHLYVTMQLHRPTAMLLIASPCGFSAPAKFDSAGDGEKVREGLEGWATWFSKNVGHALWTAARERSAVMQCCTQI